MVSKKSVDEVLSTAKVEEVVGDFVNLKRSGANMMGLCPFHNEKSPSFSVSPSKNIYKCFGCGKAGGPVQFIMEHESYSFLEAVKYLAKKYNITLEEITESKSAQEHQDELRKESYSLINEFAAKHYQDNLIQTHEGKSVGLSYLKERGILDITAKKFQLGYSLNDREDLKNNLLKAGFNLSLCDELGLLNKNGNDFFTNRVIFPIHGLTGKVIAFSGRKLNSSDFGPKYINSPETPLYVKSKVLYGMHLAKTAIRSKDECLLVEGYTDVIALHQSGIQNVVASSGTSLTIEQIRLIKRFTSNIKILYDGDAAGIKATLRALELIIEEGLNVRMVILPEPEDPDSFIKKNGSAALESFIKDKAVDFVLFKASIIKKEAGNDPVKKAEGITEIIQTISKVQDAIKRATYIQICAQELDISEEVLVQEINKKIRRELYQKRTKYNEETLLPPVAESDIPTLSSPVQTNAAAIDDDEYQERALIKSLLLYGHLLFDQEHRVSVAYYIHQNLENFDQEINNSLYKRILLEYFHELSENPNLDSSYFLHHPDDAIRNLTIELSESPFKYSSNWSDRWEMELQTQKLPDQNYVRDAYQSIMRFKLKKVQKMIRKNKLSIDDPNLDELQQLVHIKTQQELINYRNMLAEILGMRVFAN